jgi:hypothetical protein
MTKTVLEGGGHKCLTVNCPDKHALIDPEVIGSRVWIPLSHCSVSAAGERHGHIVASGSLSGQVRTTLSPGLSRTEQSYRAGYRIATPI